MSVMFVTFISILISDSHVCLSNSCHYCFYYYFYYFFYYYFYFYC